MEQTVNLFTKGLQCDTYPMMLSNDTLSDALNATIITMQGNEPILLNDMGNRRIDEAFLPSGYEPVGMKEYGGIIYVAAYNPITNKSLIGSFPSPLRKIDASEDITNNIDFDKIITDIKKVEQLNYLPCVKNDSLLYPLTGDIALHGGDKFTVFSNGFNDINITNSYNTKDGKIKSPKNKKYTLALGILNSQNEFVDITKSLVRWKSNSRLIDEEKIVSYTDESDLYKFNDGYFIKSGNYNYEDKDSKNDKEFIKKRLTMAANTYAYKLVGPLYLKLTLNHIQEFTYNIFGTWNNDKTIVDLIIEAFIIYNCPDGLPENTPYGGSDDNYLSYLDEMIPKFKVFDLFDASNKGLKKIESIHKIKLSLSDDRIVWIGASIKDIDVTISSEIEAGATYESDGFITIEESIASIDGSPISKEITYYNPSIKIIEINNGYVISEIYDKNTEIINQQIKLNTTTEYLNYKSTKTKYNSDSNTYSCRVIRRFLITPESDTFEYVIGVLADDDVYLSDLSVKGEIDLSLLGTGYVSLKSWRFYNYFNDKKTTLLFDLSSYPKYRHTIDKGKLLFRDATKTSEYEFVLYDNGDYFYIPEIWNINCLLKDPIAYETVEKIIIDGKTLYNLKLTKFSNVRKYINTHSGYKEDDNGNMIHIGGDNYISISYGTRFTKKINLDVYINTTLNNGRNVIQFNWEESGINPRKMYCVNLEYTDRNDETEVEELVYIPLNRWFLSTELLNDCYIINNDKFVRDYGNPETDKEKETIKDLFLVKYDVELKLASSNIEESTEVKGDVISNKLDDDIIITTTKELTLNTTLNNKFDENLYPDYVVENKEGEISIGTTSSDLPNNRNSSFKYIEGSTYKFILKHVDTIKWSSGGNNPYIRNKFVKWSEVVEKYVKNTYNSNTEYQILFPDWNRPNQQRVKIANGYFKTHRHDEHKDGVTETQQFNEVGYKRSRNTWRFKVSDYTAAIEDYFNDYTNSNLVFTFGLYRGESVEIGAKDSRNNKNNYSGNKYARVWWRTSDESWALFNELIHFDIPDEVDLKSLVISYTKPKNIWDEDDPEVVYYDCYQVLINFLSNYIRNDIIFCYEQSGDSEQDKTLYVAKTIKDDKELEPFNISITITLNVGKERIILPNKQPKNIPEFYFNGNSTDSTFENILIDSTSEKFIELKSLIKGGIGEISNAYKYGSTYLSIDSNGNQLNLNKVYILNNGQLEPWKGNVIVNNGKLLYKGNTKGIPKYTYDVGGAGDITNILDYSGINLVQNVNV